MRFLLLSLLTSSPAFPSGTNVNYYDLDRTSCRAAAAVVQREGAVIFQWGRELYTRVVKHPGYCKSDEQATLFGNVNEATRGCFPGYFCDVRPNSGGGGEANQ